MREASERLNARKSKTSGIQAIKKSAVCAAASAPDDPVDRLIATDPVLIKLGEAIQKHQRLLREACSADAWRIYLQIEELTNERCFAIVDKASAVAREQARGGRSNGR
jgi:hypothetical protein